MYIYDEHFFNINNITSRKAAEYILSIVLKKFNPQSIVDFGCGEGIWLEVAKELNEEIDVLGIDGTYVKEERLRIPRECFIGTNLEQRILLNRKFDLAMSFEVAEHLSEESSDIFIESLINASDRILFSAAIPGQGGDNHINEQWQTYWIQKFAKRGYYVDISLRNYIWDKKEINHFRRQNILFFSKTKEQIVSYNEIFDIVHPEIFQIYAGKHVIDCRTGYDKLDYCIAKLLNSGKDKIVIYPFGNNGYVAKEILNYKYKVKEYAIVDNKLCKEQEGIVSASEVKNMQGEFYVLNTCSNPVIYKEVLEEIKKYVNEKFIVNVFDISF